MNADPSNATGLPITERANELTDTLDIENPLGILRLLRGCDAQIFSGYKSFPSLSDLSVRDAMDKVSNTAERICNSDNGIVVMSGSGTSGRVAFLIARNLNEVLEEAGKRPCFRYLCSGGDAALLLSDELPEDDTISAVKDLLVISAEQGQNDEVMVIGITCGMSAPYVAGQIDFVLDACDGCLKGEYDKPNLPRYTAVLLGFNPVEMARPALIEMWSERPEAQSKTMLDVARRLERAAMRQGVPQGASSGMLSDHAILNPVVGPEAVCASSRMKGGSATFIILAACLGTAVSKCLPGNGIGITDIVSGMEQTYHHTYLKSEEISVILAMCGASISNKGHVYWLGESSAGILGFVDASEMPDTYGAAFNEFRGFVKGGWAGVKSVEGDISGRGELYRISINQFETDIFPNLSEVDAVIALYAHGDNTSPSNDQLESLLRRSKMEKGASTARVVCGSLLMNRPMTNQGVDVSCIVPLPQTNIAPSFAAYSQFSLKLVLNAISTGAQIMKGMVCQNHMINTGPTNNKIYHRCIRLISMFSGVNQQQAEQSLWKAIYRVDDLTTVEGILPVDRRPLSDHIRAATPDDDDDSRKKEQTVLPLAILISSGLSVQAARDALDDHKIVRVAINTLKS
jgi:N-acetylmuramic acid 6-phosphate (MurNAc-6-P) etherase